jgi:hypothetical protein
VREQIRMTLKRPKGLTALRPVMDSDLTAMGLSFVASSVFLAVGVLEEYLKFL